MSGNPEIAPEKQPIAVLFDIDNTLYDFVTAKHAACRRVVEMIGVGDGMELFRYFYNGVHGFEHHQNIRDFMQDRNLQDEALFREACRVYEEVKIASIEPYPGVAETLSLLAAAGIRMGVVTDAASRQARARLVKAGLLHYFDCVITPDVSGERKPHPRSFLMALDHLGAAPGEAWIVGDSLRREIEPGNLLGMTTVYARYGDWINTPFPAIRPVHVINDFSELAALIGLA
jgi:putative hydrolase of the HAD superfamily